MASSPHSMFFRLGLGELTDPFGEEARMIACMEFVQALDRLAPEVAADLAERLRPFLDFPTGGRGHQPSGNAQAESSDLDELLNESNDQRDATDCDASSPVVSDPLADGTGQEEELVAIVTSLRPPLTDTFLAWARRWNFGNDHRSWLVQGAATTFYLWMKQTLSGDGPDGRLHIVPYVRYEDRGSYSAEEAQLLMDPTAHNQSFTLPSQEWNIRAETKADAYCRIMENVRRTVKEELARIEAEGLSQGNRPVVVKPAASDHVEWLIRYHVKGERYTTIAREVGRSRQAVMLAVRQVAGLIDLPLREPDRRGRPRKSTTPRIVKVHRRRSELDN